MKKNPRMSSLIDKAVFDYKLIEDGDNILIGASGGKDSTVLIEYFSQRIKRPNTNFNYLALNIQSDFGSMFPQKIKNLFDEWNVPFKSIDVDIENRVKLGQKMSCYWCATQRRTELINYAMANGFNKIALGHHLDDLLETFIMNMLNKCEISTMPPKLQYKNYPVTIIRPLCYISEDRIVEYSKNNGFDGFVCTCNYQNNSDRKAARVLLENLTQGDIIKKEHIFSALKNIQTDYLP